MAHLLSLIITNNNKDQYKMSVQLIEVKKDFDPSEGLLFEKYSYPMVLYFTASWCGPCKKISPEITKWANIYKSIKFFKLDVDECPEYAKMFKIDSVPTFYFYLNNEKYTKVNGADSNLVEKHIMALLGNSA